MLVGVILAVVTGIRLLDPILAALVALNVLWSGWDVLRHSVSGLMDVAARLGIKVQEREFSRDEMLAAREVFITAATSICFPIVEIDGQPIGNGHPGDVSERIRSSFFDVAEKTVI